MKLQHAQIDLVVRHEDVHAHDQTREEGERAAKHLDHPLDAIDAHFQERDLVETGRDQEPQHGQRDGDAHNGNDKDQWELGLRDYEQRQADEHEDDYAQGVHEQPGEHHELVEAQEHQAAGEYPYAHYQSIDF